MNYEYSTPYIRAFMSYMIRPLHMENLSEAADLLGLFNMGGEL